MYLPVKWLPFLLSLAALAPTVPPAAQAAGDALECPVLNYNQNDQIFTLSWWGRSGYYYFLRQSGDLHAWDTVTPYFHAGADMSSQWQIAAELTEPVFYRLALTDDLFSEIMQTDLMGDGFPVGWKLLFNLDPQSPLDGESTSGNPVLTWQAFYDAWFGMLVYYPLTAATEGTVSDESGNRLDGQLSEENVAFAEEDGIPALWVNGSSSGVGLPDVGALQTLAAGSHTLSLWFKAAWTPGEFESQQTFGLLVSDDRFGLQMRSDGRFYAVLHQAGAGGDVVCESQSPAYENRERWYHLTQVVDYDAGVLRLYVDGQPVDTTAIDPALPPSATVQPWSLGFRNGGPEHWSSHGHFSDVRIYNRALTDAQVASLYVMLPSLLENNSDGLAAWWKLHHYGTLAVDADALFGIGTQTNKEVAQAQSLPPAPGGLQLVERTLGHVDITWSPSSHEAGISRYLVYRNGLMIGATSSTALRDAGFSLPPDRGLSLNYRIVAEAGTGAKSAMSSPLPVSVGDIIETSPATHYRAVAGQDLRGYPEFVTPPDEEPRYYAYKELRITRSHEYLYEQQTLEGPYYDSINYDHNISVNYLRTHYVYYDPETESEWADSGTVSEQYVETYGSSGEGTSYSYSVTSEMEGSWQADGTFHGEGSTTTGEYSEPYEVEDGDPYLELPSNAGTPVIEVEPTLSRESYSYSDADSGVNTGAGWSWSNSRDGSFVHEEALLDEITHDLRISLATEHMNGIEDTPEWGQRIVAGPFDTTTQSSLWPARAQRLRYDPDGIQVARLEYRFHIGSTTPYNRYRLRWYDHFQPEADYGETEAPSAEYRNMRQVVLNGTGEPLYTSVYTANVPSTYGTVTPKLYLASSSGSAAIRVNNEYKEGKANPDNTDASPIHANGSHFALYNHGTVQFMLPDSFELGEEDPEGSLNLSVSGSGSVRLIAVSNPSMSNPNASDWITVPTGSNLLGGILAPESPFRSWILSSYSGYGHGLGFRVEGLSPGQVTIKVTRQMSGGTFEVEHKLAVVQVTLVAHEAGRRLSQAMLDAGATYPPLVAEIDKKNPEKLHIPVNDDNDENKSIFSGSYPKDNDNNMLSMFDGDVARIVVRKVEGGFSGGSLELTTSDNTAVRFFRDDLAQQYIPGLVLPLLMSLDQPDPANALFGCLEDDVAFYVEGLKPSNNLEIRLIVRGGNGVEIFRDSVNMSILENRVLDLTVQSHGGLDEGFARHKMQGYLQGANIVRRDRDHLAGTADVMVPVVFRMKDEMKPKDDNPNHTGWLNVGVAQSERNEILSYIRDNEINVYLVLNIAESGGFAWPGDRVMAIAANNANSDVIAHEWLHAFGGIDHVCVDGHLMVGDGCDPSLIRGSDVREEEKILFLIK